MAARFSGWHVTAILIGFFGIIIAVNVTMAVFASRTFGGTVVDNSYVASQSYNRWLAEARAQEALAWEERVVRSGDRIEIVVRSSAGPLEGAAVSGIAIHPLGRAEPISLRFDEADGGRYRSANALPAGRWIVQLEIAQGGQRKRIRADLR
jgi:nitrogen fixation protein FixH